MRRTILSRLLTSVILQVVVAYGQIVVGTELSSSLDGEEQLIRTSETRFRTRRVRSTVVVRVQVMETL